MSSSSDPIRVLIAVRPRLLGSALANVLSASNQAVVVTEPGCDSVLDRSYSVAVVSDLIPDGVEANVVIQLPAEGQTKGSCRAHGCERAVPIVRPEDVVALVAQLDPV